MQLNYFIPLIIKIKIHKLIIKIVEAFENLLGIDAATYCIVSLKSM